MKQVLLIGGSKQSGKTSAANFLTGYKMKIAGDTERFEITEDGQLGINAVFEDEKGEQYQRMGIVDLNQKTQWFYMYANARIWPNAKIVNVADALKETLNLLFNIPFEKLYGSDSDKNEDSGVSWKDVSKFFKGAAVTKIKKDGRYERNLTIRELCQQFSDVSRTFNEECFVAPCVREIIHSDFPFYIIPDGRFKNEVEYLDKMASEGHFDLKKIYLKRRIDSDEHEGENLDKYYDINKFDAVIDNSQLTLDDKHKQILELLLEWGWLDAKVGISV